MRSRSLIGALGVLGLAGCDISPQPAPPGNSPEIRAEAITVTTVDSTSVELRGTNGAAPKTTTLSLANVEIGGADGAIDTDADGAFSIVLPGQLADVFRLNAQTSQGSAEIDVSGTTSGAAAVEIAPAYKDCLAADPVPLAFGPVAFGAPLEQRAITLTNDCGAPLTITAVSLRDGGEFVLLGPGPGQLPLVLPATQQTSVDIGFKSLAPGIFGDFVRIRFDDATGPRRIIATRGETGP